MKIFKNIVYLIEEAAQKIASHIPFTYPWVIRRNTKGRILDLGCGPGRPMRRYVNRAEVSYSVGVDIDPKYLRNCKGIYSDRILADVRALPFLARSFDSVLCLQLIYHFEKKQALKIIENIEVIARNELVIAMPVDLVLNEWNKSEWSSDELKKAGYKVTGHGFRLPQSASSHANKFWNLGYLFSRVSSFSFVTYPCPKFASNMIGVKKPNTSHPHARIEATVRSQNQMKILILANGFPPEATSGRLPYELSQEFAKRGHKVQVVTIFPTMHLITNQTQIYKGRFFYREKIGKVDVLRVKPLYPRGESFSIRIAEYLFLPISLLFGFLLSRKSDVVLCESPPLTVPFMTLLLCKIIRVPVFVRIQDLHPQVLVGLGLLKNKYLIKLFEAVEKVVYRKSDHLSGISEGYRKYMIAKGTNPAKVDVIPNWADIDKINPSEKAGTFREKNGLSDKFIITYAGTMSWPQDLGTVIDSASLLQKYRDIHFVLVGDGIRKEFLVEKCRQLKLENVKFIPLQPRDKYLQILQVSDVCLVSLNRSVITPTLPSKTLDIMACGKPIIANVPIDGDLPKLLADARCGLAVEPENPKALSEAILSIRNEKIVRELGRNARKYLEKHFSLKTCAEKYEEVILRALEPD